MSATPSPSTSPVRRPVRLRELDYSVVQQCMHCGMCLPTCPTYADTKLERHGPRGRISLMRSIADDRLDLTKEFAKEMYFCLGCLACETACPAGVSYSKLFEAARSDIEDAGILDSPERNFWRWFAVKTLFCHPRLLRLVGRMLWLFQASGLQRLFRASGLFRLLPKNLRELEPQTPTVRAKFSHQLIAPVERPLGARKFRVGLLTGCVQDLAFSDVNRDTADVLLANGCEVVCPPVQHCCGSLHAHNGETGLAADLARRQIDLFQPETLDAIITNAGGCGSHLKHYTHLLADDPRYAERAKIWDSKAKDIHQWLVEIGFRPPASTASDEELTVAYHESCHLCHGQKVVTQPRAVLRSIPGVQLQELPESNWCCGSAGIYNITQPQMAAKLQERKVRNIEKTACTTVATSNPGCHLQLQNGLRVLGTNADSRRPTVTQPVSLLAAAYRRERTAHQAP